MNDLKQKFCHNCGNQLDNGAVICVKCGNLVGGLKKGLLKQNEVMQVKKVFSVISAVLAICALSVWAAQLLSGFYKIMYIWSFWLIFSLSFAGSITGLVFGIISKDKLGYCLNTAAIIITIMLMANWVSVS